METLKTTVVYEKETPGTVRYREPDDVQPLIGTVYIKKFRLPKKDVKYPPRLLVEIREAGDEG